MFYYTLEFEIRQKRQVVAHYRIDVDGYRLNDAKMHARSVIDEYINAFYFPATYTFVYHRRWSTSELPPKKLGIIYK